MSCYHHAESVDALCASIGGCPFCQLSILRARLREVEADRDGLKLHYDAAGPEHNLLALLDLYHERETAALAEVERMRPVVRASVYYVSLDADSDLDACAKLDAAVEAYLSTTHTPPSDPERVMSALGKRALRLLVERHTAMVASTGECMHQPNCEACAIIAELRGGK